MKAKKKKSNTERRRKRRTAMWNENPYCCYCGCLTVLPETLSEEYIVDGKPIQPFPDNTATTEHKYSRLNPLRRNIGVLLLSCYKCNQERGKSEFEKLPQEISRIPILSTRLKAIKEWQKSKNV